MDRVDDRFFAAPPERTKAEPWRTTEEALLREHYPKGGLEAALAVLPGRERKAIYSHANRLGLRAPENRGLPRAQRFKYTASDAIDAEIRRVYECAPRNGEINALARRLLRPSEWIHRRAIALGIAVPRRRPVDWSSKELDIIEANAHRNYEYIRDLLTAAGFKRSESAIAVKVNRLGFDRTDPDRWNTGQLAKLMGVTAVTVLRWITHEGLPAARMNAIDGSPYIVERAALRRWIAAHAQLVDPRKAERYWFIDLLLDSSAAAKGSGARRKGAA